MKKLRVTSELAELDKIRNFLKRSLRGIKLIEENSYIVELSLLEICINIMRYAYPEDRGEILLKSWLERGKIFFEIRDNGIPFDPSKLKKPDLKKIVKEKRRGGFGIFLTRELMDGFEYRRDNGQNILIIYKKISP